MYRATLTRPAALALLVVLVGVIGPAARGQTVKVDKVVDKWVTVIGVASGTNLRAADEALAAAQRKAVEQTCGIFLKSQTKAKNYTVVYDKIFANAVGFVREHEVVRKWTVDDKSFCKIRARVSTQRFEENWVTIAATIDREDNPRVVVGIAETITWANGRWVYTVAKVEEGGTLQTALEDFLLSKGIKLMDRSTTVKVTKRDVLIATVKNDTKSIAALGAQYKADAVIMGHANAKYSQSLTIAGTRMHQYVARLNIRVVQCDSAEVIAVKTYSTISNTLQRSGGERGALAKLGKEASPKVLAAIIEAWRKRQVVSRTTQINIKGMDFAVWKKFKAEVSKLRGIQALRLREITDDVARVDVEYRYSTVILADRLTELKSVKLEVQELTASRLGMTVTK